MIPQAVRDQVAQLAHPSNKIAPTADEALATLHRNGDWWFDVKWDGIRCLVFVDNGDVRLINRRQRDITFRYPELVEWFGKVYEGTSIVLDGEIVVFKAGTSGLEVDFPAMHKRDAQENERSASTLAALTPASFVAFDLLFSDEHDYRELPYAARRTLLITESARFSGDRACVSPSDKDGEAMWAMIKEHKLEGLIAKLHHSTYRGGRSQNWIKIKPVKSLSAIVSGYDYGDRGSKFEHTMGALHLVVLDDGQLVPIGKVGTGFTEKDRDWFKTALDAQNVLIVEVEYQEVSPNEQLRFPSYKGVRTDLAVTDCTKEQMR